MAKSDSIRVVIADDHAMVRSGLRLFLMAFEDLRMVGEASNGQEAVRLCAQEHPDVVLMDLIMPVMDGIHATREIRSRFPRTQVIGITSFFEAELIQEMLDAGAISFVMKNISAADLAVAIRDAARGKPTISEEIHESLKALQASHQPVSNKGTYNLSAREKEVLGCMVAGMSNAEIASALVISLSTAKYHVSSILTKLEVANRAEAVSLALQERLVEVPHRRKEENLE
jgi:two-component system, NarL family, response regulator LiaR